jgi:hypothetical protein
MLRRRLWKRARGQVLVIFAVSIPVIVLLFLFVLGLAAVRDVQAHAAYALSVATRAGARQVAYGYYGGLPGGPFVETHAVSETQTIFRQALSLRHTGLDGTPEDIAGQVDVRIGYGSVADPWESPFTGQLHAYPVVAAQARVPVRVWLFRITVTVVTETEVR